MKSERSADNSPLISRSFVFWLCLLLLGAGTAIGQPASDPTIDIHPPSLAAGNTLLVRGHGFSASCGVDLFLDSTGSKPLANANVAGDGTFSIQLNLPREVTPGAHKIVARGLKIDVEFCGGESSGQEAEAPVEVTSVLPILLTSVTEATPGTVTQLSGADFCTETDCSAVTVLIDGLVVANNIIVEDDGSFVVEVAVPAIVASGAVTVMAIQERTSGDALRAHANIIVTVKPNTPPEPGPQ